MGGIASQITSLTIVYSTVYSGADQSKHQSSASLAFVWGIHRGPVNSPHKWPVTRKMLPFDDVIMNGLHNWGVLCQKQVSRTGTSNYIPQTLWYVITSPCCWYLLLAQHIIILRIYSYHIEGLTTFSQFKSLSARANTALSTQGLHGAWFQWINMPLFNLWIEVTQAKEMKSSTGMNLWWLLVFPLMIVRAFDNGFMYIRLALL